MARTKKKASTLTGPVVAKKSFATTGNRVIRRGQVLDASDPAVAGREHLFMAVVPVEQTTAAPGEMRSTPTRPKTKQQPKPKEETKQEEVEEAAE